MHKKSPLSLVRRDARRLDVKPDKVFRIRLKGKLGGPTKAVFRERAAGLLFHDNAKEGGPKTCGESSCVKGLAVCAPPLAVGCPSTVLSLLRCFSSRFRPLIPRENGAGELALRDDQLMHVGR